MQSKNEKIRKTIWIISFSILGISLLCPTYCTNVQCSPPGSGLTDLLFGWAGAIFVGNPYFAWFANPFFIAAIFINRKVPVLSLIFSLLALSIALTFLKGGVVWLNEAGHKGYITQFQIGYWLWLASMVAMVAASVVAIIPRARDKRSGYIDDNS